MRAVTLTKSLVAASATNIAASQSLAGAGALILNGSAVVGGVAVLDSQRRVIITSAGADGGLTWTVIGTDDNGNPIKDQFPGATGVAASNLNFKTVTSITSSGATASTVTAGTNTVGSTPWALFADTVATPNMSLWLELVSGAANATVEYTYDPFLLPIPSPTAPASSIANGPATLNPIAVPLTALTSKSANTEGNINFTIHAWRLTINSGNGVMKCVGRQAGLASP